MATPAPSLEQAVAAIRPPDEEAMSRAAARQATLTKPPGSLGQLEELSIRLAGMMRTEQPRIGGKAIIIAAGDHGVVAQGVTAYPQDVTAQMVLNFLAGGAAINVMCRQLSIRQIVVDAGVATKLPPHPDLRALGIGRGTADISRGPAMTREQAQASVENGISLAQECVESGIDLIGTGDMGIGNTTASAAITSAITGLPPKDVTGDGAGRPAAGLDHKIAAIKRALEVNSPDPADGLAVLSGVGGFEIGVLSGVMIGAAASGRPVVLDGFISGAAALIANVIAPAARDYMIAAHLSAERGHRAALNHLGLSPLLDLNMRLGEGTGAALAMPIIEAAVATLSEMATFGEAGVSGPTDEPGVREGEQ
ncbi:MAG: nicotinate-nucleotide--dimethylbenzimidazole phosphoribosyltransferase [Dehalococcoidia bacterium]|nr:nicotinate-nucleotide--dimethylbenzimidazole phosphoribosyltransferase [Dehalococcoidia bacterium]